MSYLWSIFDLILLFTTGSEVGVPPPGDELLDLFGQTVSPFGQQRIAFSAGVGGAS